MDLDSDIVVVGCGAAGATAAGTAASLGSKVLLLEEHNRIGIPSHCSGHVGIHGMRRLGVELPERIIKNQIQGAIFHSPSGQVLRLEYGAPITWVLDRRAFDQHMGARAEKAGARIQLDSRAVSTQTLDEGLVQMRVVVGGEPRTVSCRIVIDCEGAAPILTPHGPASERHATMCVSSAQVHVDHTRNLNHDVVEVYFGSTFAPGFFAWIMPWRDGSAKVGLAARGGNARLLLERFMTRHPDASQKLKGASRRDASFHLMPLGGPISRTFYPGMLIAGDSAQQVKPTTGGGIVFSLICGRIAGEVAHEACSRGDASDQSLSSYERRWKKEIGGDLDLMRHVRKMFFGLPDRYVEKIFRVARALDVATVLTRAEDVDMQGRALARYGLNPRLALSLLYSSVLSLPFLGNSGNTRPRPPRT